MNLNELVKTTRTIKPPRIVLHGIHGIGKSTWASTAPAPIFLQTEDGLTSIDVAHFPLAKTMQQAFDYLDMLIDQKHEHKTLIIDTIDWFERLIWKTVCDANKVVSIEQIGYGKGYQFAITHWDSLFEKLDKLRDKGMVVVLLAHNEVKTFSPPDGDPFDRYQIKLHKAAAGKIEEWADVVLFAGFRTLVNVQTGKVINNAERVIHTTNRPAWKAKTRYDLPEELPLDNFSELLSIIRAQSKKPEAKIEAKPEATKPQTTQKEK